VILVLQVLKVQQALLLVPLVQLGLVVQLDHKDLLVQQD
jgi:hypothetical protein